MSTAEIEMENVVEGVQVRRERDGRAGMLMRRSLGEVERRIRRHEGFHLSLSLRLRLLYSHTLRYFKRAVASF